MKPHGLPSLFRLCPKTGRIVGIAPAKQLPFILLPVVGFLALIWWLIRVVPKPSRAAYPCQRVAAPLAGSFLVWLGGITGAGLAFRHAQARMRQARYASAGLALLVAAIGIAWATLSLGGPAEAVPVAYTPHPANEPIGEARGLAPGRVAWIHDPSVADWDGISTSAGQRWFDMVDQTVAEDMLEWALATYAGTVTTGEAWDAIFRSFNGGAPYQAGEKIFIKTNFTTSNAPNCADTSYNWNPPGCGAKWTSIGNSPQLMVALLDQLVNSAGVAQSDITMGDPTGLWVNELYNPVHAAFPGVNYLDARGTLNRAKATTGSTRLYWSAPEGETAGKSQDYLLRALDDATYMINLAILKSHNRAGITVAAKNHYGSLMGASDAMRKPTTANFYDLHVRLPLETQATPPPTGNRTLMAQYRPLVDMNGHAGMGGKTILNLLDAIYAGKGWDGIPSKWAMAPFNNDWPQSVFLSMDPVAIDSVAFDFLSQQWPDHALGNEGVQDYLHEMALADDPPSGTFYDPEGDGVRMASQGVHEHWNDATLKLYSRNLGEDDGIELLYRTGDPAANAAVRRTDRPIEIDGAMDPIWDAAPAHPIGNLIGGGSAIAAGGATGDYRVLYDDTNLYLLVRVTDGDLVNDSALWSDDDSVGILIDGDYSRGATYDGVNDFELGFRWNDTIVRQGVSSAAIPQGIAFEMTGTDSGYLLEARLPLAGLGIVPGYGRLYGLDVWVNDDDDGATRDARWAWWATVEGSPQLPNAFGAGALEGPQKTQATIAPQDAGMLLSWTHFAWNDAYEVHGSTSPYFLPDEWTRLTVVEAPTSEFADTSPGAERYYVIRALEQGLGAESNRTGYFQFDLTTQGVTHG